MIDWFAFLDVAIASVVGAGLVVGLFALGLRLLSSAGHPVHVEPAEFTDAITVVTPEEAEKVAKRIRKARKRSPLTAVQKRWTLAGARGCFVLCVLIGFYGIYLVIPAFHPSEPSSPPKPSPTIEQSSSAAAGSLLGWEYER